jgi:thiol-disulfide isomerase/thioredoxin
MFASVPVGFSIHVWETVADAGPDGSVSPHLAAHSRGKSAHNLRGSGEASSQSGALATGPRKACPAAAQPVGRRRQTDPEPRSRRTPAPAALAASISAMAAGLLGLEWYRHRVNRALCILSACVLGLLAVRPSAAEPGAAGRGAGAELLGSPAREWDVQHWLGSPALSLAQLRGEVVLVRWWTAPDCPFCAATAPTLNDFDKQYRARGLRVIGFYHHKAKSPFTPDDVARYAKLFGFEFPIAVDGDWRTLDAWWLSTGKRDFTSVSFLIDRRGAIRYIHPGGRYVRGDADHAQLQRSIEQLLAEPR